jgi:hypothetical protein
MRVLVARSMAVVLLVVVWPCGPAGAADDPAEAPARRREEAVKTVKIEYKRTQVVAKGAESEAQIPPLKPKTTVPDREMTLESTNRLVIDGVKIRIEDNHPFWTMPAGILERKSHVGVCDGSIAKTFYADGIGNDIPTGFILHEARLSDARSVLLTPIMQTFRGLNPVLNGLPLSDLKPSGVKLPIGGAPCQEYAIDDGRTSINYWLDASKDYALRRMRTQQQGRLINQIDVTSYRQEDCGWVPISWVFNEYSAAGATLQTDKVQVLELQLNDAQPAQQFVLQFPPGTDVMDARQTKMYRVQPDGSMREVDLATGKELSRSVPQPGAPWYQGHQWLLVGLGVLLCAAAAFLLAWRKKRTRRA